MSLQRQGQWLRRAAVAALASAAPWGLAAAELPQLSYEPVALGWSAPEVERAARRQVGAALDAHRDRGAVCAEPCRRAQRIFERLLPVARGQTALAASLPWSLSLLHGREVEALSLPGGQVLVSEAFVQGSLRSDEELAFVLAHEMSHAILEHERQALTFARMLLPRDVPRSAADMYVEMDHNFALLKSLEMVLQQGELEADELGLLMASAAGFDPRRQLAFVEREALRDEGSRPLVRTHPRAGERLERLRASLPLAERVFGAAAQAAPAGPPR